MHTLFLDQYIARELKLVSDAPFQECQEIIEHVFDINYVDYIKNSKSYSSQNNFKKIDKILNQRKKNIPLAYILGQKFFYNSNFKVNENTLIPRPETEKLVDLALEVFKTQLNNTTFINILEIGAGTGCVGISIVNELLQLPALSQNHHITFWQTEISTKAFEITKQNIITLLKSYNIKILKNSSKLLHLTIQRSGTFIELICSQNDCIPLQNKKFDLVISNPPYIPSNELSTLPTDVSMEPKIALNGGENGTEIMESFITKLKPFLKKSTKLIFEIHSQNKEKIISLLQELQITKYDFIQDLAGKNRFLQFQITNQIEVPQ